MNLTNSLKGKEKLEKLIYRYEKEREFFYEQKGKAEQLKSDRTSIQVSIEKLSENIEVLEKVKILLQRISKSAREQAKEQAEMLVTDCLQFIFDSNIEFKIEITESRGRPEAEFYVLSKFSEGDVKTRVQDARGGGVVDIISLAIRVVLLQNRELGVDGPLILDEPAKHVSDEYIVAVTEFLKKISNMFGRQIILVTHNKHLIEVADRWYRVHMENNVSKVQIDS